VGFQLRVYGSAPKMVEVADRLGALPGLRHVIRTEDAGGGGAQVVADVGAEAADAVLDEVHGLGVAADDVELVRLDAIGSPAAADPLAAVVWTDLVVQAGLNARLLARYLVFLAIAGIIAGFGVIYSNGILIVGAMAVSPDILPITATCTGLVLRRWRLASRSLATLVIGLALACTVAALMTFVLDVLDLIPEEFEVKATALSGLDTVDASTVIVAFVAGVAAILALETRATFAIGVAISVTTIPASAYLGVAAGVGQLSKAEGAVAVLAVNIAMLLLGGSLTLIAQRWLRQRVPPR
jgi:uncharacterized hydrophobic protein (TIGR00271 family)